MHKVEIRPDRHAKRLYRRRRAGRSPPARDIVAPINRLTKELRRRGVAVIWVLHATLENVIQQFGDVLTAEEALTCLDREPIPKSGLNARHATP